MVVYIITFFLSIILFIIFSRNLRIRNSNQLFVSSRLCCVSKYDLGLFFSALPPMFIASVRYYVGTDYLETYYTGFYRILDGSNIDGFEFGYWALNKSIQFFSDNAFLLFIVTSIIFVGVVYATIREISVDVVLSIILFFVTRYYFIGMNGIRQFIGLAFLAYSLKYVLQNNCKKFLFCVLLSSLFHYTCLLFVPIFWLSKIRLNLKIIFVLIFVSICFFTLGLPYVVDILGSTKYGVLAAKYDLAGIKFTLFTVAFNIIIFFISYVGVRNSYDLKYNISSNIQFLALLSSFGLQSIPLMERVYWIFSFPIIVTFPFMLCGIRSFTVRSATKWAVVTVFAIYMIYDICVLGDHDVLPYQTIFGKLPIHYSGWEWYGGKVL